MSFSISQKNNPGSISNGPFPCPINCFSGDIDGYNAQLTETSDLSPTLVNEFRMGYTKQGNWFFPQTIGFDASTAHWACNTPRPMFSHRSISAAWATVVRSFAPGTNAVYIENLYDPSDRLHPGPGRHILHFGVEVLMGAGQHHSVGQLTAGNFTFTGNYTAQNGAAAGTTGAGLADFLLGDVQNWKQPTRQLPMPG